MGASERDPAAGGEEIEISFTIRNPLFRERGGGDPAETGRSSQPGLDLTVRYVELDGERDQVLVRSLADQAFSGVASLPKPTKNPGRSKHEGVRRFVALMRENGLGLRAIGAANLSEVRGFSLSVRNPLISERDARKKGVEARVELTIQYSEGEGARDLGLVAGLVDQAFRGAKVLPQPTLDPEGSENEVVSELASSMRAGGLRLVAVAAVNLCRGLPRELSISIRNPLHCEKDDGEKAPAKGDPSIDFTARYTELEGDRDQELVSNLVDQAFSGAAELPGPTMAPYASADGVIKRLISLMEANGLRLEAVVEVNRSAKRLRFVSDEELKSLTDEISGNQQQAWRLLYFSVIATAGLVSLRRGATHFEMMLGIGTMLAVFLFMQIAAAKKIFEIAAFISVCRDKSDAFVWQQAVPLIAASDMAWLPRWMRFWYLTQKIAIAYALLLVGYVYTYLPRRQDPGEDGADQVGWLSAKLECLGGWNIHYECLVLSVLQAGFLVWLWVIPSRKRTYEQRIRACIRRGGYAPYLRWH